MTNHDDSTHRWAPSEKEFPPLTDELIMTKDKVDRGHLASEPEEPVVAKAQQEPAVEIKECDVECGILVQIDEEGENKVAAAAIDNESNYSFKSDTDSELQYDHQYEVMTFKSSLIAYY